MNLPQWIDLEAWQGFIEMRKKIKTPLTERGMVLVLNKLEAMRAEERIPAGPATVGGNLEAQVAARVLALRSAAASGAPVCSTCGPRPETDAIYCSNCGRSLQSADHCRRCRAEIPAGSRFCEGCGEQVAA